ncbi:MAG: hypothetical protein Q9227_000218 [Pyrenula ochraceoflavens]
MVFNAELHPFNRNLFVASLFEDDPHLVDMTHPTAPTKHRLPTAPLTDDPSAPHLAKLSTTYVLFSQPGTHIFAGTSKGWLNILSTSTRTVIFSEKLCNHLIPLLRLSNNGQDLLVNSSDRIIRVINLPDLSKVRAGASAGAPTAPLLPSDSAAIDTPLGSSPSSSRSTSPSPNAPLTLTIERRIQDLVNRLRWNSVALSSPPHPSHPTSPSTYLIATTYMKKDIYIWERSSGSILTMLEAREEQGVVEWHPNGKPLVATAGVDTGIICVWGVEPQQKWTALAPDFAEVEENVEHEEREDEFDVLPEEEVQKRREDAEDEVVDVWTVDEHEREYEGGKKEKEIEEESFVLPVVMGIEASDDEEEYVSVGVGTMRRKEANEGREWNLEDGVA